MSSTPQSALEFLAGLNIQMIKLEEYKKRTRFSLRYDRIRGITYKHREDMAYIVMKPEIVLPLSNLKANTNVHGNATYCRTKNDFYAPRTFSVNENFMYVNPLQYMTPFHKFQTLMDTDYDVWYPQVKEDRIPELVDLLVRYRQNETMLAKCKRKLSDNEREARKEREGISSEPKSREKKEDDSYRVYYSIIKWSIDGESQKLERGYWDSHDPMSEMIECSGNSFRIVEDIFQICERFIYEKAEQNIRAFELGVIEHALQKGYLIEDDPQGSAVKNLVIGLSRPKVPDWAKRISYKEAKESNPLEQEEFEKLDPDGLTVEGRVATYSLLKI